MTTTLRPTTSPGGDEAGTGDMQQPGRQAEEHGKGERASRSWPREPLKGGDAAGGRQRESSRRQQLYLCGSPPRPLSPLRRRGPPAASGPPP